MELSRLYDERSKEFEVELAKFKQKLQTRMTSVQKAWESATVVRTREKVRLDLLLLSRASNLIIRPRFRTFMES